MYTAIKTFAAVLAMGTIVSAQPVAGPVDQAPPAKKHKRHAAGEKASAGVEQQIKDLQDKLAAQQSQIDTLNQQLNKSNTDLQSAQASAADAKAAAERAAAAAGDAKMAADNSTTAVSSLQGSVSDLRAQNATVMTTTTELKKAIEAPVALRYKGITITPGGFLAGESVWRQRGTASDINTPFSSIPYTGSAQGQLSEFNFSGRQSRLSLLAEGKADNGWTYRGYVEADFLSAGTTSNNNQSNSYTLRQRQAWAQAQSAGGWYVTGGQMWSLLTETKIGTGIENRQEALPMTIDPQYSVGFVWTRQPGIRAVKRIGENVWFGISAEQAQTLNLPSSPFNNFVGVYQLGTGGGLYNATANYAYNKVPDFVAKAVWNNPFAHVEIGGVVTTFRDRYYANENSATPTPAGATNLTNLGGGVEASARVRVAKIFDVGAKGLIGAGIERYGSSTLPQVIVKPDGSLEPLRGGSFLATVEAHPTPRFDLYANFGIDYAQRTTYTYPVYSATAGDYVDTLGGYGAPNLSTTACQTEVAPSGGIPTANSCAAEVRAMGELTVGYWYRFYKGPAGTLQQGMQYSYLDKETWQGTGGSPKANDNMWFTSFRYYLP